ncbi:sirohydrochlorin chelatase [Nocardia cyriacigeorgica]|uniref:Sirohydrochlorin chelatase n=1 Tax=Nocardia cyriacigeorgica TaxID=135487 RepID=A0ABX0CYI6_9NOCA|nr:sirohydrochlorin chelatase [Nocardia cyriacigeorgica]NEW42600.1 sirohydrochlorin chelatase [Nocardia cyriacigeorgica]NEW58817.1 sirohydrochlorin chelatase [Nocardia cyriacigeorgica]
MSAAIRARSAIRAGGFGAPALIAVAHGSRDPRSAATMAAVTAQLAAARPDLDVRLAFLDLNAPSVDQVIDAVAAQGHTRAIVVPLLLGSAFHARVDLPGLLAGASARHPRLDLIQADVLGADPRLVSALRDRVITADHAASVPTVAAGSAGGDSGDRSDFAAALSDSRLGVAVAAVGSSSAAANVRTAEVARMLAAATGWKTEICFATTGPSVTEAAARLRARGAERVLVAPWFLAPGLLTDRLVNQAPDLAHTQVLGPHPALTDVVLDRYDAAADEALLRSA